MSAASDAGSAVQQAQRLHSAGKLKDAETAYRAALERNPHDATAVHLLGLCLYQQGHKPAGRELVEHSILMAPDAAQFHFNLGNLLMETGDPGAAVGAFRRATELQPDFPDALNNLSVALSRMGNFKDAAVVARLTIARRPSSNEAVFNLAQALRGMGVVAFGAGEFEKAAAHYAEALKVDSMNPDARLGLARSLAAAKHPRAYDALLAAATPATKFDVPSVEAVFELARWLDQHGRLEEAEEYYRRILSMDPKNSAAMGNLAAVLGDLKRSSEAIEMAERAAELDPDNVAAMVSLGALYSTIGRHRDATRVLTALFERESFAGGSTGERGESVVRLSGELRTLGSLVAGAMSNLVMLRHYDSECSPREIFEEALRFGRRFDGPRRSSRPLDRTPGRKLRIGYISPDFRAHAVATFADAFLDAHDRDGFEIFCYSNSAVKDSVTRRLMSYPVEWREIHGAEDRDVARMIEADRIDILVDLAGHTGGNRLPVFGLHPAPVQATYLGFPSSTGMRSIDYRIADVWTDPPGLTERYHSEKLVRLPHAFFCYRPSDEAPPVNETPALSANGAVTFGCMNAFRKITPRMLHVWASIVRELPGSRLIAIESGSEEADQRVRRLWAEAGVSDDRLELVSRLPYQEYLRLHQRLDIALDPFPFNGHTTTCDTLWMGVPVVSLASDTAVSRAGVSTLNNVGLGELVATSDDEYRRIAIDLARDLPRLERIRSGLRPRMAASPICDRKTITRDLEAAFRQMWEQRLTQPDDPSDADVEAASAHYQNGAALDRQGKLSDAIVEYRSAIALRPDWSEAHGDLGAALAESGELKEGMAECRRALELDPWNLPAKVSLAAALIAGGEEERGLELDAEVLAAVYDRGGARARAGWAFSNALMKLQYADEPAPRQWFEKYVQYGSHFARAKPRFRVDHDFDADRRIRVGLVSSDFRQHPVGQFLEPILRGHDRERIEFTCFNNSSRTDPLHERIRESAEHFHPIYQLNDDSAAEAVVSRKIDILIDLAGHSSFNRLSLFGLRPAPLQATWLGFPATTGIPTIDYRITDVYADPVGLTESLHTEQLLRLPHAFYCYRPHEDAPDVAPPPALSNGYMTFGSFNWMNKLTPRVCETWARVLSQFPTARLLVVEAGDEPTVNRGKQILAAAGIDANRVRYVAKQPLADYLRLFNEVDIAVDTFPFAGHTVTCDGLWMGVPTVTLAGQVSASRSGVSVLSNLGLTELIAADLEVYVRIAHQLATNLPRLAELSTILRQRMLASPILNGTRIARDLEQALRAIWQTRCAAAASG